MACVFNKLTIKTLIRMQIARYSDKADHWVSHVIICYNSEYIMYVYELF